MPWSTWGFAGAPGGWGSGTSGHILARPQPASWGVTSTTPRVSPLSANAGPAQPTATWFDSPIAKKTISNVSDPAVQLFHASNLAKPAATSGTPNTNIPGFLNEPGTGENWWAQHQQEINDPGKFGQYLEGAAGRLFGRDYQPNNTSDAYTQMQGQLGGGPQQGTQNAWDISNQLRNKTAGEGLMGDAAQYFQGPNRASGYADETKGFFATPTDTQGYSRGLVSDLPGMTSGLTGYMPAFAGDVANFATSRGDAGHAADAFMPGLLDKGYSENLYESGNKGLNTFYDREEQKRTKALQDRAAASGMFGSGATLRGLGEIEADLGASQARDMAGLAGQADQAHLARVGAGGSLTSAASQEANARMGLGITGLTAADASARGNVNTMLDAGRLGLDATSAGDAAALARTMGGSTVARSADDSMINQGQALGNLGHQMTADEISRLGLSGTQGMAADEADRARSEQLFNAADAYDKNRLAAAAEGRNTEQLLSANYRGLDQDTHDWITKRFGMSEDVQNLLEKRFGDQFDRVFKLGNAQAGTYAGGTGAANDEQAQAGRAFIQNLIDTGKLSQAQGEELMNDLFHGAGLVAQGAKLLG